MKKTYILLALTCTLILASCSTAEDTQTDATKQEEITVETSTGSELSGNVVLEIPNTNPLAGETLTFDVELMSISSKGSGALLEDTAEVGDSVEVHYVGTLDDGEQFDSSRDRGEPLPFTVGVGQMIPGFDAGVLGMKVGETKTLTLAPEEAYGPSVIVETVAMADLKQFIDAGIKIEVGAKLPTQAGEITITDIQD